MLSKIIFILLTITLLAATITDMRKRVIPNSLTLPMLFLLSLIRIITGGWEYFFGLIPAVILFLLYIIKPNGIGAGDIKLIAVIGIAMGLTPTISITFWMCLNFLIVVMANRLMRKKIYSLPLAPLIFLGYIITLIFPGSMIYL